MPWETSCVLPNPLGPKSKTIPALCFTGTNPDHGHQVDAKRVHTLFHHACFSSLVAALGFAPPDEKLKVPQFLLPGGDGGQDGPPSERPYRKNLEHEDVVQIIESLHQEETLRHEMDASLLSLIVDGAERATLNPRTEKDVRVEINERDELLEVRRKEDNLLLAVCLLVCDDFNGAKVETSSTVLEGGQLITFQISSRVNPNGTETTRFINVAYQQSRKYVAGAR